MANYWYWYWNRHLNAVVLPALKKLCEFHEEQVVPAMELRSDAVPASAEPPDHLVPTNSYADSVAVIERLRADVVIEQFGLVPALAVYTNAICEALYLEVSKFLLLLHRKEVLSITEEESSPLPALGDLPSAFAGHGVDLTRLEGFEAYDLLRLVAHYHEHIPGDVGEELQRRRPEWVNPNPLGRGIVLIKPSDVRRLYEDLRRFLRHVVEALHPTS